MDAPGGAHVEERVLMVAGETARLITLRAPPPATPPPPGPRETPARTVPTGAWVLGGIGVAALAGSGAFALVAHHDLANLDATCSPRCTEAQTSSGRTAATVTYVLLATGGVAVTGAVVWALAAPSLSSRSPTRSVGLLPHLTLAAAPTRGGAFTALGVSF
jgi:hypothetical protein